MPYHLKTVFHRWYSTDPPDLSRQLIERNPELLKMPLTVYSFFSSCVNLPSVDVMCTVLQLTQLGYPTHLADILSYCATSTDQSTIVRPVAPAHFAQQAVKLVCHIYLAGSPPYALMMSQGSTYMLITHEAHSQVL